MKKYLFCVLFTFIFVCCATQKKAYHAQIYNDIYDCQGIDIKPLNQETKQPDYLSIYLHFTSELRKLDYLDKLGYSKNSDTIYVLEEDDIQGYYFVTVWNKCDTLCYRDECETLVKKNRPLFTNHIIRLVSEWNIDKIRKAGKIITAETSTVTTFRATKITFDKGKYHIDCISF